MLVILSGVGGSVNNMDENDLELLRFEKKTWRHSGAKAAEIHRRWGLSLTAYWQRILTLAGTPEALAAEPVVVNRINRRRQHL